MIFDLQRFSTHDGPGIRTVVFLKGCPLSCAWCENPESQSFKAELLFKPSSCIRCGCCLEAEHGGALEPGEDGVPRPRRDREPPEDLASACPAQALRRAGRSPAVPEILEEVLKDRSFFAKSGGGITVSGGEPLAQADFTLELLEAAAAAGLDPAMETCLAVPRAAVERAAALPLRWLADLKHTDPARYRAGTGGNVSVSLGNLEFLAGLGADLTLRVPVIPGFNDDDASLESILDFAAALPAPAGRPRRLDLLPYHDFAAGKYAGLGRAYAYAPGLKIDGALIERHARAGRDRGLDISIGG